METELFKKVAGRFKKEEFQSFLSEWGYFSAEDVESCYSEKKDISKRVTVTRLTQICQNKKLSSKTVGELDLLYNQKYSHKKKWDVLELTKINEEISKEGAVIPSDFERILKKHLKVFYHADVNLGEYEGALWMRIYIHEGPQYVVSNTVFLVHYPQTKYLITTAMKASHKEYVTRALLNALKCSEARVMPLSDKHVKSLALLAHGKSKGSFCASLGQDQSAIARHKKKRKAPDAGFDSRVLSENSQQKRRRQERFDDSFGSAEQPTLEKVEYELRTPFHGTQHVRGMEMFRDDTFSMKVKFAGSSVLEGIRNLVSAGKTGPTLPTCLRNLPSARRNKLVIRPRRHPSSTQTTTDQTPQK